MTETLVVPRAPFDMEEPWSAPPAATTVRLRRATDAGAPRLATTVASWHDGSGVHFLFSASDDHIQATMHERDAPLYEQDVVEVFVAPESTARYYELEVSPHGVVFDAVIDSPDGVRKTMRVDRSWNCEGLVAAVRKSFQRDGAILIDTLIRIPFLSIAGKVPVDGETWRANFFRIDRHAAAGDEYTAWQPTLRDPADFHVVAAFGRLQFAG
jgi:hypothetical protein